VPGGTVAFRIKPRAGRTFVKVDDDDSVTVSVTAPPVDNKANEQCIALFAKQLGCPKRSLHIIKGGHGRDKVIACDDLTSEEILKRLKEQ